MIKYLLKPFLLSLAIIAGFMVTSKVIGNGCQELYGGYGGRECPRGEVMIDKLVWKPETKGGEGVFVDNLGTEDHKFTATQEIIFRLTVKNISDVLLDKVEVRDRLPGDLEYISGPDGASFNSDSREIYFEVKDLEANESRDFEIRAKVKTADMLPQDKSLWCVVNEAEARIPENTDTDTSQICIEKPIVEELPDTGPMDWLLILGGSGVFGIAGITMIKRAKSLVRA